MVAEQTTRTVMNGSDLVVAILIDCMFYFM
jgi:hypothetical protein